jgi:hypothetical protein
MQNGQVKPLTINTRALVPKRVSIPTPPPTAHPLAPTNLNTRADKQHQHQFVTHLQNLQHVSVLPGYHQQTQQVLHAPNATTMAHAQSAPPPPPPPHPPAQIIQAQVPILPPSSLQQDQQLHQPNMTHPPASTILTSNQRLTTPLSAAQIADAVRLTGLQQPSQAQAQAQTQARPQGQQAQRAAAVTSVASADSSGTQQTRASSSLRPMHPPTQLPERPPPQMLSAASTSSTPATSSSSQAQQSQHQHQQQQQHQHDRSPMAAAFRVLQPAKMLLEQTWATAIAAVQRELAVIQAEHVRAARERECLAQLLQRSQTERAQALQALQDTKGQLRECMLSLFFKKKKKKLTITAADSALPNRSC